MNYQKIYDNLISKAKSENRKKTDNVYYERHHIIPKSLGGKGNLSSKKEHPNLVLLTAKEHFIAHKLLHYIHPNDKKLLHAYWLMVTMKDSLGREYKISSTEYERLRKKYVEENMLGENNPVHRAKYNPFKDPDFIKKNTKKNRGRKHSDKTKKIISQKAKGRVLSEETKRKISESQKGKKIPREVVEKIAAKNRGKKRSPEFIEKMKKNLKGKPNKKTSETNKRLNSMKFECPHCNRTIGGRANFIRFHNDNCKFKK